MNVVCFGGPYDGYLWDDVADDAARCTFTPSDGGVVVEYFITEQRSHGRNIARQRDAA